MEAIARLRKQIHRLEGTERRLLHTVSINSLIDKALPYNGLPLGCVHEVQSRNMAGAIAFASLLAARIPERGPILYVAPDRSFFPLGLLPFGIGLERWIHVTTRRPEDLIWTVSEGLRCPRVSAVLAVTKKMDLTLCRRLQLAAESSGATGFLLGNAASDPAASVITRWRVASLPGPAGRGFDEALWELELAYCRSGRPGKWRVAVKNGQLEPLQPARISVLPARPDPFLPVNAKAG